MLTNNFCEIGFTGKGLNHEYELLLSGKFGKILQRNKN